MYNYLIIIGGIIASIFYSFLQGKKSVEINENKKIANDVKEINKIKKDVSNLSDDELDKLMQKYTRND